MVLLRTVEVVKGYLVKWSVIGRACGKKARINIVDDVTDVKDESSREFWSNSG